MALTQLIPTDALDPDQRSRKHGEQRRYTHTHEGLKYSYVYNTAECAVPGDVYHAVRFPERPN